MGVGVGGGGGGGVGVYKEIKNRIPAVHKARTPYYSNNNV